MKYRILICLFIALFLPASIFSFNWSVPLYSVFSSLLQSFTHFSWITDHFVCASNQELYEARQEVKQTFEDNKVFMQEYAHNNGKQWYEKTKKEFDKKITIPLKACTQNSFELRHHIEQVKKRILLLVENQHRKRIQTIKADINNQVDTVNASITDIIKKITALQEQRDTLFCHHYNDLSSRIGNLRITMDQKYLELLNSLNTSSSKQQTAITDGAQERKKDIENITRYFQQDALNTQQKLIQLNKLCTLLTIKIQQQQEKNKNLERQVTLLKAAQAKDSYSSMYKNFNKSYQSNRT